MPNEAFEEALAMIKSGDMLRGQRMLWDYLQTDPKNENGWMWLAQTLPGDAQRLKIMLECLKHNPESQLARETADKLRARLLAAAQLEKPAPSQVPQPESPDPTPAPQPETLVTPSPVITPVGVNPPVEAIPPVAVIPPAATEPEPLTPFMVNPVPPPPAEEPEIDIPFKAVVPPEPAPPPGEASEQVEPAPDETQEPIPPETQPAEDTPELKPHYRLSAWVWLAIIVLLAFLGGVGYVFVSYYVPVLYPSPTPTVDLLAMAASQTAFSTDTLEPSSTPTKIPTPVPPTPTPTLLPTQTDTPVKFEPVSKPVLLSAPNESGAPGKLFQFVEFNDKLYSPDFNNISRYDPLTQKMVTVLENPAEYVPAWLTAASSRLFFFTVKYSPDGMDQDSLWVSDGTTAGTKKVLDGLHIDQQLSRPAAVGNDIYFIASQKNAPPTLWYSDGSVEGTLAITTPQTEAIRSLTPLGDRLYFTAFGKAGQRLWVSDGTIKGTKQFDAPTGTSMAQISSLAVFDGTIYLTSIDIQKTPSLLKVDAGSLVVVNSFADQGKPLDISSLTVSSGKLYLKVARASQAELWATDGTSAGSSLLHTFPPEQYTGQAPNTMVDASGSLYCVVTDTTGASSLWRSDGTPGGTHLVYAFAGQETIINPVDVSSLAPQPLLVAIKDRVYFLVETAGKNNLILWQSDDGGQGVLKIMEGSRSQVIPAGLERAGASALIFTDIDSSTYLYQP